MQVRTVSTKWLTLTAMVVLVALVLTWFEPAWATAWLSLAWGGTAIGLLGLAQRIRHADHRTRRLIDEAGKAAPQVDAQRVDAPATTAAPPQAATAEPISWTREQALGEQYTLRPIGEFIDPSEPVEWERDNPYTRTPAAALLDQIRAEVRWRYHHAIPEIPDTETYYSAYALRVDALLEMVSAALVGAGIEPSSSSFLDIGAAEGYVVNHLLDGGASDVDAVELNETNIRRMWLVRALKGQVSGRIGRIDLERADWCRALGRSYDVTLALGVIYHMENPLLFARNLYAATAKVALVESDTPVFPRNQRFRGFGSVYLHRDRVTIDASTVRYLTELRPDRQALAEILLTAGFRRVDVVPVATAKPSRYFTTGEKTMMVAFV